MKLFSFPTPALTAEAVTQKLIAALALHGGRVFNLAISGGSTPAMLFQLWRGAYNGKIAWNQINLYWVDERCVGEESIESNYGEAKRGFIDYLVIKPKQVYPINGTEEPTLEAARYSNLLKENLPQHNGYPVFDMVILGVGSDGHTSSLFPGQKEVLQSTHVYEATVHPATGQSRIALTAGPICQAGISIFHVTGASKAAVVEAMLASRVECEELYPALYISRRANHVELYTDDEALGHL